MKRTSKQTRPLLTRFQQIVHSVVVPHRSNNYRPHLIRAHGILAIVGLAMLLQIGYNFSQTGEVLGQKTDVTSEQLLAKTNQERQQQGEANLRIDESLNQAATLKAQDMFKQQYWAHNAPNGSTPWSWFKKADYTYSYAGENLAKGFSSSSGVVTAWMNSAEHRKNLLGTQYQDVGFAVVAGKLDGEDTTVVVALYGAPLAANQPGNAVLAAINTPTTLLTRLGVGVQSMNPGVIGAIVLLLAATGVALAAHAYRHQLPKPLRKSWYRHHGLYKAAGMLSMVVVLIALYGGGQI